MLVLVISANYLSIGLLIFSDLAFWSLGIAQKRKMLDMMCSCPTKGDRT